MLPQIDAHVLTANPQFARLHRSLCVSKLHANGTSHTTNSVALKEQETLSGELSCAYVAKVKKDLVKNTLHHVAYRSNGLPDELQDVVRITLAQLESKIDAEDQDIADGQVQHFLEHIDEMITPISNKLRKDAEILRKIANPRSNDNHAGSLTDTVNATKRSISESRSELGRSRAALAVESSDLLLLYQKLLEAIIRRLEQTVHGSVARASRSQAEYLAHVAEGVEKKLRITETQVLQQVYASDVREELKAREAELGRENAALKWKLRVLEQRLEEYENVRGMRQIAEAYVDVEHEISKVKGEIDRLHAS